ncbi:alpha/beta hydrolase [Paenarthrobacter aurescens]|uniref:alpha/beta hydrolase n=1 Tax=Paenarthrobacter aurescens TaxID=43663 RepID=UPI0035ED6C08
MSVDLPILPLPLEEIAADGIELIRAFREAGSVGFSDVPLDQSRVKYEASCAANGIPREAVLHVEDLLCPVDGGSIRLRHYQPLVTDTPEAQRPVVLFLHGGGWVLGSVETHDHLCRRLAAVSRIDVVSADYRLAPEYPFPVPLQDSRAALRFVRDAATERGWDPRKIIVAGDSAGGNLATVLATDPRLAVSGIAIIGQMLLYPVTNLRDESHSYSRIAEGFPLTAASMRWFRGLYLGDQDLASDLRASPGLRSKEDLARRNIPSTFLVTVGLDPLSAEGIAYAGLLASAGAAVEHHHLPRHYHGLFTSAGRIPTGAAFWDRAAEWARALEAQRMPFP